RVDGNQGSRVHYEPNTYGEWQEQPVFSETPMALEGAAARYDLREEDHHYFTQPDPLVPLMSADELQRLFQHTARAMDGVERHIMIRHITHCYKADPDYGKGVAAALGVPMSEVPV